MIKVLVQREEKIITSLSVSGHANSAPHGEDLVCAAVSAIITGGINAIENKKSFKLILNEGDALIELKTNEIMSKHDEIVLETIYIELKTIEESYNKFIKILEK